jgi:two-component system copper resistance phosphate regulon response regulator CusR
VHILVVEDEIKMARALKEGLEEDRYEVSVVHTGEEGFYAVHEQAFDLVILDVMLPGRDGLEILRTLRRQGNTIPVLLLTAKDAIDDRVRGLDVGADDYLVKPFAFPELLARIRALLRRGKADIPEKLTLGDMVIDSGDRSAARGGRTLDLTSREFDLLEYLLRHQGRVVSREMLARDIWKDPDRFTPLDNVIDVQVARLRRKVDDQFEKKLLHTIRGVGFVLREDDKT